MPMWFDSTTPTKFLLTVTNYLIIATMTKDKFNRRCCYNCTHHLDYQMTGRYAETVVCAIRAEKECTNALCETYIGVDYNQRIEADHAPCHLWEVDTNVPKGFKWPFLEAQPKQLTINFE